MAGRFRIRAGEHPYIEPIIKPHTADPADHPDASAKIMINIRNTFISPQQTILFQLSSRQDRPHSKCAVPKVLLSEEERTLRHC